VVGAAGVLASASFEPNLAAWDAWSPDEVARRFSGVRAPWYVAAGWAIDLFLGEQRRAHEDLEIAVPHERFREVAAALSDCELFVVGSGRAVPLALAGDWFETHHQTWVRERATGRWRLDIFREPSAAGQWVCRRDERIQLPYERVIARSATGIPYARPEIVLLFKAKAARPKDDDDFAAVRPHLQPEQRRWLNEALQLAHPGHRWLSDLG
jgi:hypothetical protein